MSEDKYEPVCGSNPSGITNAALLHEKHNPELFGLFHLLTDDVMSERCM